MILGARPVRTIPLLVLGLLACVLVSAGVQPSVVVCYSMDGRVSLESVSGMRCNRASEVIARPDSGVHTGVSRTLTGPPSHCAPCVDIPISFTGVEDQPFLTQDGPSPHKLLPPLPASVSPASVLASLSAARLVPPPSSPEFSPALASLRTVVLLI